MHIQKITNTTFGYNKKLNNQLIKKLDAEKDQNSFVTTTIRDLNTLCNNTENILEIVSKTNDSRVDNFYDVLRGSKINLSILVEEQYPELKFIKRESDYYIKQGGKITEQSDEQYPWQTQLGEELFFYFGLMSTSKKEKKDREKEENINIDSKLNDDVIDKDEETKQADETSSQTVLQENQLVEVFKPSFSSPKGFESLGGMTELKEELLDKIISPALNPELAELDFKEYGKRAPRGFLFYGPPGCGKTYTVEALSMESHLPLLKLKIGKAGSHYINKTSMNYQNAFDYAAKYAKLNEAPVLMFIDEMDGMTKERGSEASVEDLKQMGTLLNLIETARDNNIIVIGATNKFDLVDSAIKRRFDNHIYIGMPDTQTRKDVLKLTISPWSKAAQLSQNEDDLQEIAEKFKGFPTSAISIISAKAADRARKEGRREITKEDFFTEIDNHSTLKIKETLYKSKEKSSIGYVK